MTAVGYCLDHAEDDAHPNKGDAGGNGQTAPDAIRQQPRAQLWVGAGSWYSRNLLSKHDE